MLYKVQFTEFPQDYNMHRDQLNKYRQWFGQYVKTFYCGDKFVDANIKLKEHHTDRVCGEMKYLCRHLNLTEDQSVLAETIGLFHDVGRFSQFVKYRTYLDSKSENHCLLALKILQAEKILDVLTDDEQRIILKAIEFHGAMTLPDDLDEDVFLYARLIRDADKLDIYGVILKSYRDYKNDPGGFVLDVPFPDVPYCSDFMIDSVMNGRLIDYRKLETINDVKLLQIGWVYNIYFAQSLVRLQDKGCLKELFEILPDSDKIEQLKQKITAYVKDRIENNIDL